MCAALYAQHPRSCHAADYAYPAGKVVSPECKDLIAKIFTVDPTKRITIADIQVLGNARHCCFCSACMHTWPLIADTKEETWCSCKHSATCSHGSNHARCVVVTMHQMLSCMVGALHAEAPLVQEGHAQGPGGGLLQRALRSPQPASCRQPPRHQVLPAYVFLKAVVCSRQVP